MQKITNKLLACLLVAALMLSAAACNNAASVTPTPAQPTPTSEAPIATPAAPTPSPVVSEELTALSTEEVTAVEVMLPVFDALVRTLNDCSPEERELQSTSPDFFWSALHYFCANTPFVHPEIQTSGAQYMVPASAMKEIAAACFADYSAMLEMPPQTFPIAYDKDRDVYFVDASDAGDTFTQIIECGKDAEGNIEAKVAFMYYEGEGEAVQNAFLFTLVPNANKSGAVTPLFAYSAKSAVEQYLELAFVTEIYEVNGQQFAKLQPVQEVFHLSTDLDSNGQPYGNDFLEYLADPIEVEARISDDAQFVFEGFEELFPESDMKLAFADSRAFFLENAAKTSTDGEHVLFALNTNEGVIYNGAFVANYYFAG